MPSIFSFLNSLFTPSSRKFNPNDKRKPGSKPPPIPNMPSSTGSFGSGGGVSGGGNGTPGSSSASSVVSRPLAQGVARPLFMCKPYVNAHLLKGNFKTIVVQPKFVDKGEWIALNTFEFYEYLKLFNNVVAEFCQSCPSMSAGPGTDYFWLSADRKPRPLPAAQYIDYVMTWINNRLSDEAVFPTRPANAISPPSATQIIPSPQSVGGTQGMQGMMGAASGTWLGKDGGFPQQFYANCQAIFKQMFRVFAHIYHTHFDKIVHLSLEAHLNSFFAHFIMFSREFELLDKRDLEPLLSLIESFDEKGVLKS